jgi:uncharacterized phage-associated protein
MIRYKCYFSGTLTNMSLVVFFNGGPGLSTLDVASYFIQKANKKHAKKDFTPLKLQKILYYAQGLYLAEHNAPLFKSPIYAWTYGPVVKTVYDYYKGAPPNHITANNLPGNVDRLTPEIKKFLDEIWDKYGSLSAWTLVGMTHITRPWIDADKDPTDSEISSEEMRKYFSNLR